MGNILNSMVLVYGIGSKGTNVKTCATHDGIRKLTKEYKMWSDMLFRCTEKGWIRSPPYNGTTCSENFKSYEYFHKWCQEQIGFSNRDENGRVWHLDKDILGMGKKHYSEDTCVFVPENINKMLIKSDRTRGEHCIGVNWHKAKCKFMASCRSGGRGSKYLGYFNTEKEAFLAYKAYKETYIKQIANEYKHQLDPRAYEALMKYEVNEND